MYYIQENCSYEWIGLKKYSYNDDQMSNIRKEKKRHLNEIKK